MKIIKILLSLLLLTNIALAGTMEEEIENLNKEASYYVENVLSLKKIDAVVADVFSADIMMKELAKIKSKGTDELVLILPNVKVLKQNIEKLSGKGIDIFVFLWDRKVEDKYYEDRSYPEYEKEKIGKYKNVKVFKVPAKKEYVYSVVRDSIGKPINNTEFFNKEIKKTYIENSRYDYYKALGS